MEDTTISQADLPNNVETPIYKRFHSEHEEQYDQIIKLAALNLNCNYAALSIKGKEGFWLKSRIGFDFTEVPYGRCRRNSSY